jgi:hypothetical protein
MFFYSFFLQKGKDQLTYHLEAIVKKMPQFNQKKINYTSIKLNKLNFFKQMQN